MVTSLSPNLHTTRILSRCDHAHNEENTRYGGAEALTKQKHSCTLKMYLWISLGAEGPLT